MPEGISTSLLQIAPNCWVEAWDIVGVVVFEGVPKVHLRHKSDAEFFARAYVNDAARLIKDIATARTGTMPFV